MITGSTKLVGVMGWPIAHSLSPMLHNYWLQQAGIDAAYVPLPVPPNGLATVIPALAQLGFVGVNITIPHKENICHLVDQLDPIAAQIGAVNTLHIQPDHTIIGMNTDASGFMRSVQAAGHDPVAGAALLLGAGGAARAVIAGLLAAGCPKIYLANRSQPRAEELAQHFNTVSNQSIQIVAWNDWPSYLPHTHTLINSTACGLNGQDDFTQSLDNSPPHAAVCDLVYKPLQTGLLRHAVAANRLAIDGLGMLLYQAQASFKQWFGVIPPVDAAVRRHILS